MPVCLSGNAGNRFSLWGKPFKWGRETLSSDFLLSLRCLLTDYKVVVGWKVCSVWWWSCASSPLHSDTQSERARVRARVHAELTSFNCRFLFLFICKAFLFIQYSFQHAHNDSPLCEYEHKIFLLLFVRIQAEPVDMKKTLLIHPNNKHFHFHTSWYWNNTLYFSAVWTWTSRTPSKWAFPLIYIAMIFL